MKKKRMGKWRVRRTTLAAIFLVVAFLSLTFRVFAIQVFDFTRYQQKVIDQMTTESAVRAPRGEILDAAGRVLATERTVYRISLYPSLIYKSDKSGALGERIAKGLATVLGHENADRILAHLTHKGELERTVMGKADVDTANAVLGFIKENRYYDFIAVQAISDRYYPYHHLAAQALGFTGSDGQGLYGLELAYNSVLAGQNGAYVTARDAKGNVMPNRYEAYQAAIPGNTLHTTLDAYVQAVLEEQLETTMIESGAMNRVCGIVMNVKTGAILAMATAPTFDLNTPFDLNEYAAAELEALGLDPEGEEYKKAKNALLLESWSNKAVSEIYMPGSTFKTLTCSMVLEERAVTNLSEGFYCSGSLQVADRCIHCHKVGGHGSLTFAEGLQNSCNPVMMTIAARIGTDKFYQYVRDFGLLEKSGIDTVGEGNSIFHAASAFTELDLATASFGQNFKVSVLQMITAVSAVANGGKLLSPYLVEKITDVNGNTVFEHEVTVRREVISEETAKTVSEILAGGVAGDGGAKNAYVAGYRVAAKTGTSEKIGDDKSARIGSCIGYAPADDPEIAVIIVVDEPTSAVRYGSVVAAPYVANVFSAVLPYLDVEAVYTEEELENKTVTVPDLMGLSRERAEALLKDSAFAVRFEGEGDTVLSQLPKAGTSVHEAGATLVLTLGSAKSTLSVPNLVRRATDATVFQ